MPASRNGRGRRRYRVIDVGGEVWTGQGALEY